MQGTDQEETPNEVSIIIAKRNRKYMRMMHGQCCSDNCGCCPNLKPPAAPGPHDTCMLGGMLLEYNEAYPYDLGMHSHVKNIHVVGSMIQT